jgi:glycosyltransferase involved in cell wall biosynthesis
VTVSIETPVFKGARLRRCIDSVLHQSSPDWTFTLVWDGGDQESREILLALDREKRPNVTVYFEPNRGIARARRFLTERTSGDFILPLDDDDALPFYAIERLLDVARQKPWASIIRGQRKFIDEDGKVLDLRPWFPFEPRHYQSGMVTDVMNHSQPYLFRRAAYDRTSGWEGFEDFRFAGEDCDIYLKLEETGTIELVDEVLYYYRVHSRRASLELTDEGAYEMWRRLADKTIARLALPLRRTNDTPPFVYERLPRPIPTRDMAEVIRVAGRTLDLSRVLRQTTKPIVCLMRDDPECAEHAQPFAAAWQLMQSEDLDLAAPDHGCLVLRREVMAAVGGLDEGYETVAVAIADLCLKARQRQFRCIDNATVSVLGQSSGNATHDPADLVRLRAKWSSFPDLLA